MEKGKIKEILVQYMNYHAFVYKEMEEISSFVREENKPTVAKMAATAWIKQAAEDPEVLVGVVWDTAILNAINSVFGNISKEEKSKKAIEIIEDDEFLAEIKESLERIIGKQCGSQ